MTIVLIEHSMDVVLRLCHQITVLSEGRVIAEGPPERSAGTKRSREFIWERSFEPAEDGGNPYVLREKLHPPGRHPCM